MLVGIASGNLVGSIDEGLGKADRKEERTKRKDSNWGRKDSEETVETRQRT